MRRIIIAAFFAARRVRRCERPMKNGRTEDELIKMDKEWTTARAERGQTAVSRFIADDFWETVEGGDMHNKTQYLATIAPSTDKDVADDYAVRVFGNTAIMTHRGTITGAQIFSTAARTSG